MPLHSGVYLFIPFLSNWKTSFRLYRNDNNMPPPGTGVLGRTQRESVESWREIEPSRQRWKKRQMLQTRLCYFPQLVLIFGPRARKTMREECFTHFIISTRAISTSTISINNGFLCYLQIFHSFIGHLLCFLAIFLVLIFLGLFCISAYMWFMTLLVTLALVLWECSRSRCRAWKGNMTEGWSKVWK